MRQPVPMQQTQQPAQPQLGERRTTRAGHDVVWDGANWRKVIPAGGSGGSGTDPTDTRGVQASAEQRGRANLAVNPAIDAMRRTISIETTPDGQIRSPFTDEPFAYGLYTQATAADDSGPWRRQIAAGMAGPDFTQELQAYKQFEQGILPMFSGSAVTQSEAQRFIQGAIPAPEDDPATVALKQRQRMMITNGAAAQLGLPPPFPQVPSWTGGTGPINTLNVERLPGIPLAQNPTARVRVGQVTMPTRAGARYGLTPSAQEAYSRLPSGFDPQARIGDITRPMYLHEDFRESDLRVGDYGVTPDGRLVQGIAPQPVQMPRQGAQQPAGGQQPAQRPRARIISVE